MARIRGKNTGPEMIVRSAMWAAGLRYRLYDKALPGRPDIVFPSKRIVLFIHGCFWHAHPNCPRNRLPKTRVEWWRAKFARNKKRDEEVRAALAAAGWNVLVLWECQIEKPSEVDAVVRIIKDAPRRSPP